MSNRRARLFAWLLLSASAQPLSAMQPAPEPDALKDLRKEFYQKLIIASGSLNDFYSKALATSETYFAGIGDYEQARAIKARREDLAAIGLQAATAKPPTVNSIALPVEQARTSGVVIAKAGDLINWRSASCSAEWTLTKFLPGAYQVQFTYTMIPKPAVVGSTKAAPEAATSLAYILKESSLLAATTKNECPINLATTKDTTTFTSEGTIQLSRPPITLKLAATASYPGNVVMIRDVKLVQVSPTAPTAGATPSAPAVNLREQLTKLKAAFPEALAKERKPLIDDYSAKLDALAAASPKDESLAEKVDNEKRRAAKSASTISTKSTSEMETFDELDDVRFVPDPANTGDAFKIVTKDGKEMRIRLAFVSCASKDPSSREMKTVSAKFGIEVEAALTLASDVQTFTAEYLQGRDLDLLIKHARKNSDLPQALVFIENIGLFQSVLIDHGFGVVDVPPPTDKTSREGEYVTLLRERENQARHQTPRPGGWGLGTTKP